MYLVSPDYLSTVTSKNSITSPPPPPPAKVRKAPEAEKKHTISKRRRSAKQKIKSKKKKDTPQREHERWTAQRLPARREYDKIVKVRAKLNEADVERKRQIKTVADFLKQVLPSAAASSSPPTQLKACHSQTETVPPCIPTLLLVQSPQNDAVSNIRRRRLLHLVLGRSFMRRLLHSPSLLKETVVMMMMTMLAPTTCESNPRS